MENKWSIHYGRTGIKFLVHNRRTWLHNLGSNEHESDAQTQSRYNDFHWSHLRTSFVFYSPCIHAYQDAVNNIYFSFGLL